MELIIVIAFLVAALVWAAIKIVKEQNKNKPNEQLERNIKGQELSAQKADREALRDATATDTIGFLNGLRKDREGQD